MTIEPAILAALGVGLITAGALGLCSLLLLLRELAPARVRFHGRDREGRRIQR